MVPLRPPLPPPVSAPPPRLHAASLPRRLVGPARSSSLSSRLWRRFGPLRLLSPISTSSSGSPCSALPQLSRSRAAQVASTWPWASVSSSWRWRSPWPGRSWPRPAARAPAVSPARVVVYFFGSLLFMLLIAGLVLIVLLLLREVRLNERQSNFVSAVTHELKTPVASLKLYLDTLEYREVPRERRAEFYRTMRQDIDRLNATINSVLNAGDVHRPARGRAAPARPRACRAPRGRADLDAHPAPARGHPLLGPRDARRSGRRPGARDRRCSTCSTTPSSTRRTG